MVNLMFLNFIPERIDDDSKKILYLTCNLTVMKMFSFFPRHNVCTY